MDEKDRWEQLQYWLQAKDARIDALMRGYAILAVRVEHLEKEVGKIPKPSAWNQGAQTEYGSAYQQEYGQAYQNRMQTIQAYTETDAETDDNASPADSGEGQVYGRRRARNRKKPRRTGKIIGNTAFYLSLVLIIVIALFVRAGSSGAPNSLAGYTGLIVLTESMQSEIPKGSLVITKSVDPATLEIGDDITFLANQTTTLTHRIVGVTENYQNTGGRAFETQGVMNPEPDQQLVMESNVVGKVIFHSEALGKVARIIIGYWPVIILTMVVLFVLIHVLQRLNRPEKAPAA